jgi:PPM family protein phosphatase
MSGEEVTCMRCGATAVPADRFCESCGIVLSAVHRVAVPRIAKFQEISFVCTDCGSGTYVDEYCSVCGDRRTDPDREQADLDGIVLVTDRGLEYTRNEDAAAAGIVACGPGDAPYAIAVAVCDGVSTSSAADMAAKSASMAGVDAMLSALAASRTPQSAVLAGLSDAAKAAAEVGSDSLNPTVAPSCTYSAVAVVPTSGGVQIAVGNVGDGRVYWLPEPPAPARCLTVDDSLAQELIAAGAAADSEAVQAGAHTLTRWFGADAEAAPWSDSSVRSITTSERGLLVMCTDGLWNYLPEAGDIARVCAGNDASAASCALVDYALSVDGTDNITVAVIPIGGRHDFG